MLGNVHIKLNMKSSSKIKNLKKMLKNVETLFKNFISYLIDLLMKYHLPFGICKFLNSILE